DIDYHERSFDYDLVRARGLHWKSVRDEFGPRRAIGIRADESRKRLVSAASAGAVTKNSLRPLAWWTAQEVFSWLAYHRLPVSPVYAMLGNGRWPREHIRTHSLAGTTGDGMGRHEWEREYYSDMLNRQRAARAA